MSNQVRTSKYNCLTFLPYNLFEQFSKMANLYFLIVFALQLIPVPEIYSLSDAILTIMPLSFVVLVSMIKDAFEDGKRKKSDKEENRQIV